MNKGLDALKTIRHIHDMECGKDESINKDFDTIEKELKALEIIKKHLSITNAVEFNDKKEVKRTIEVFDIDLWNDGKQKEDFEFVKEVLNYGDKN